MREGKITFEGKKIKYIYPTGLEEELKTQIPEIFQLEYYKLGRRNKDAVYLDLGANIGMASIYFYPYAKQIYAIEPSNKIYEALVTNTKNYPKIKTFKLAIAHRSGNDQLYSLNEGQIPQTLWGDSSSVFAEQVEVKTIEDFMNENQINHVDVMKIDVEESEYVILPSQAFLNVADRIDFIIGEAHFQKSGGFPDVIPLILEDAGFKTTFIDIKHANYTRKFVFNDSDRGDRKEWKVPYKSMFVAERK